MPASPQNLASLAIHTYVVVGSRKPMGEFDDADDSQRQRTKLTSHAILRRQEERGTTSHLGSCPDAFVESFNGPFRNECLNEHISRLVALSSLA